MSNCTRLPARQGDAGARGRREKKSRNVVRFHAGRAVTPKNLSPNQPAFIFIADESPLRRQLGVYEFRG
jgi:hypothetical protein